MAALGHLADERVARARKELEELRTSAIAELGGFLGPDMATAKVDEAFADASTARGSALKARAERATELQALIVSERTAHARRQEHASVLFRSSMRAIVSDVAAGLPAIASYSPAMIDGMVGAALGPDVLILTSEPCASTRRWRAEQAVARRTVGLAPVLNYASPIAIGCVTGHTGGISRLLRDRSSSTGQAIMCVACIGRDSVAYGTQDGTVGVLTISDPSSAAAAGTGTSSTPAITERGVSPHAGAVRAVGLLQDGRLVSAGEDGAVMAYDVEAEDDGSHSATPRMRICKLSCPVARLAVLAEGYLAVAGGRKDPSVRVIDPVSRATVHTFEGVKSPLVGLVPLPDGRTVTACEGGELRLFGPDGGLGELIARHATMFTGAAEAGDATIVVVSAADDLHIIGAASFSCSPSASSPEQAVQTAKEETEDKESEEPAAAVAEPGGSTVAGAGSAASAATAAPASTNTKEPMSLPTEAVAAAGASGVSHVAVAAGGPVSEGALCVVGLPGGVMAVGCESGAVDMVQSDEQGTLVLLGRLPGGRRGAVVSMAEDCFGGLIVAYESGVIVQWGFGCLRHPAWERVASPPVFPSPGAPLSFSLSL